MHAEKQEWPVGTSISAFVTLRRCSGHGVRSETAVSMHSACGLDGPEQTSSWEQLLDLIRGKSSKVPFAER